MEFEKDEAGRRRVANRHAGLAAACVKNGIRQAKIRRWYVHTGATADWTAVERVTSPAVYRAIRGIERSTDRMRVDLQVRALAKAGTRGSGLIEIDVAEASKRQDELSIVGDERLSILHGEITTG